MISRHLRRKGWSFRRWFSWQWSSPL